jgi:hypothetical protein
LVPKIPSGWLYSAVMSTATFELPDTAAVLDFTPECDVEEPAPINAKCTKPAAWIGVAPCGHDSYFCEVHHYDQRAFTCNICGLKDTMLATYRWIRI